MQIYPNRGQYKNAVLNEMFPSEQNGGYKFIPVIENGEPIIASGGNAIVFKVIDNENVIGNMCKISLFILLLSILFDIIFSILLISSNISLFK